MKQKPKQLNISHIIVIALWIMLSGFSSIVYADSWSGKVVGITDGDTITVMKKDQGVKIRLAEIDCPESGQPFGKSAKQLASDLCFSKVVIVQVETIDRYGRTVAHVKLPSGLDLNEELLRAGLAWHYKQYSSNNSLAKLESEAQAASLGIWSQKDPIAPWDWRHSSKQPEKSEAKKENQLTGAFHGNINSRIFHRQGCRYYDCTNCTALFNGREQAIGGGFRPCKICNP